MTDTTDNRYMKSLLNGILMLAAVLTLISCNENPAVRMRFHAEKLLYDADRVYRSGSVGPRRDDAQIAQEAAAGYRKAMDYSLAALDSVDAGDEVEQRQLRYLAFRSTNLLSQLHYSARHFDTSVTLLENLLDQVPLQGTSRMTSLLNLGKALQSAGLWDSALAVYSTTLTEFYPPIDDSARVVGSLIQLPFHLYRLAVAVGDSTLAAQRLGLAEAYYRRLETDFPQSETSASAAAILARLYLGIGRPEAAVAELQGLLDPANPAYVKLRIRIADIMAAELHQYDSAIAIYENIRSNLTEADSLYKPVMQFKTALAYLDKGDYELSRQMLVDLKRNYSRYYDLTPQAQQAMAQTFERQDKWSRAETEYKYLIESYRGSEQALATYLYISDKYRSLGQTELADKWLDDAVVYYNRLAERNVGTIFEVRGLRYKAQVMLRQNEPEEAVHILTSVYDKYPETYPGQQALLEAAGIERRQIGDQVAAEALMERLRSSLTRADVWEK